MAFKPIKEWRRINSGFWHKHGTEDSLSLIRTGERGLMDRNYQFHKGWVVEYNPEKGSSQRIVFPTRKEALGEILRFTNPRKKPIIVYETNTMYKGVFKNVNKAIRRRK